MSSQSQREHKRLASLPVIRARSSFILITGGVALAAILSAAGQYRGAAVVAAAATLAGVLVSVRVKIEVVLITWFATTPLASFYIRFPTDRSVITYNRIVFALLAVMLLARLARTPGSSISEERVLAAQAVPSISKFEAAWLLLSIVALISALTLSNNAASAVRIAADTFWLPLVAFHLAKNYADLGNRRSLFLAGCIALALFLFVTGAFEFATGTDAFQYKGSELVREGERRVNGPFAADSSYAIICLMLFLVLRAAPRLFRVQLDRAGKLVYWCALAAVGLGALLPMFRAVAIALVPCGIVLHWYADYNRGARGSGYSTFRQSILLGPVGIVILLAIGGGIAMLAPSLRNSRLADPRSVFGRLATWQAAAEIAIQNPVFGVGLGNYAEYFDRTHYYADEPVEEILDTRAANSPHSNVLWIAAEFGLTGLALYIAANLYLFVMGWRALRRPQSEHQRIAAACFLALVVAYWIPGLTLASGYYGDLNLCFFFLAGVLSNQFPNSRSFDFDY